MFVLLSHSYETIRSVCGQCSPGRRELAGVQTLDRAVGILDTIARPGPCTLADLVRETGLARPTAHRLAVALERHALVVRDRDGRFRLGARLVGWGAAAGARARAGRAGPGGARSG